MKKNFLFLLMILFGGILYALPEGNTESVTSADSLRSAGQSFWGNAGSSQIQFVVKEDTQTPKAKSAGKISSRLSLLLKSLEQQKVNKQAAKTAAPQTFRLRNGDSLQYKIQIKKRKL